MFQNALGKTHGEQFMPTDAFSIAAKATCQLKPTSARRHGYLTSVNTLILHSAVRHRTARARSKAKMTDPTSDLIGAFSIR